MTVRGCKGPPSFGSSFRWGQADAKPPKRATESRWAITAGWFRAKKTAPLWAKRIEEDQTIETLEGSTTAKAGDFLCRGAAGEFWPQSAERLNEKYSQTEETDADGFRKFLPKSEVMAAQVDHPFCVKTSWGELKGEPGDFILKSFDDKEVEQPESVWIVDRELFADTYEKIGD